MNNIKTDNPIKKTIKYKCRAECEEDILKFWDNNIDDVSDLEIFSSLNPLEVEATFNSPLELSEIIKLMENIFDGHVMYQTVKPIDEYTGERDYDI